MYDFHYGVPKKITFYIFYQALAFSGSRQNAAKTIQ